jgi:hypothetical protein
MITNTSDEQKNVDQIVGIDNSDYNDEEYIDESDVEYEVEYEVEYDSDDDSDYEPDDEDDTDEDENNNEEEERHQFYRQQAFEFDQYENNEPVEIIGENDSDTDVLSDNENIIMSPPPLRRERPEDYLTPNRPIEVITPSTPRNDRYRVVLSDITNIVPRRLAFN